jgi:mono/diheme cytochrome c family protein
MRQHRTLSLALLGVLAAISPAAETAGQVASFSLPQPVQGILRAYCYDCHGEKKNKGKVRLDTLPTLEPKVRLELLSKLEEQVHLGEMPPEDEKQLNPTERKLLSAWVRNEIVSSNAPSI